MAESERVQSALSGILTKLKEISNNTRSSACCTATTSAGTGDIPAGFASVSIAQTGTGDVAITMSDATVYTMTAEGEVFVQSAPTNKTLPAYTIAGSSTWKWVGIK